MVLAEEDMNDDTLFSAINELYENRNQYIKAMSTGNQTDAVRTIVNILESNSK